MRLNSRGFSQGASLKPGDSRTMKNSTTKPASVRRLKVLFADDEVALQELISLELPRLGHEATICPDGLTAICFVLGVSLEGRGQR